MLEPWWEVRGNKSASLPPLCNVFITPLRYLGVLTYCPPHDQRRLHREGEILFMGGRFTIHLHNRLQFAQASDLHCVHHCLLEKRQCNEHAPKQEAKNMTDQFPLGRMHTWTTLKSFECEKRHNLVLPENLDGKFTPGPKINEKWINQLLLFWGNGQPFAALTKWLIRNNGEYRWGNCDIQMPHSCLVVLVGRSLQFACLMEQFACIMEQQQRNCCGKASNKM